MTDKSPPTVHDPFDVEFERVVRRLRGRSMSLSPAALSAANDLVDRLVLLGQAAATAAKPAYRRPPRTVDPGHLADVMRAVTFDALRTSPDGADDPDLASLAVRLRRSL